jgi:hypothetical protein
MFRVIVLALAMLWPLLQTPQAGQTIAVPPDSPQWELQGRASVAEHQGRKAILLDSGAAILKDFEMGDGVIDVDTFTPASRGFFGIQFRIANGGADAEWVYLRQHKSGRPDAMQYTPVLNTGLNWQLYNGPGFTGALDIPRNEWFHMRLEVAGAQAKLYVKDMGKPALVVPDLKSGNRRGQLALVVLTGETYFAGFSVRSTPDATWARPSRPTPPGTLTKWSLSPAFDAQSDDLERYPSDRLANGWQDVEAEWPGLVAINRYRESPHPVVSFANDFSRRLDPQPGMKVVYARTRVDAERDEVRKLYLGYSDDVVVFLNRRILYHGRSPQNFRDPDFLGILGAENDAIFLPLRKGANELLLAVGELGGGWGFVCRLGEALRQ